MTGSLKLGGADPTAGPKIRRLNRLPIMIAIALVVIFLAVIFYGLTSRGLRDRADAGSAGSQSASSYADQLTRGVPDGIIGEPAKPQFQPRPAEPATRATNPFTPHSAQTTPTEQHAAAQLEPEEIWRARLEREQQEQYLRERHRQRMARVQANDAAFDSPIAVNIDERKIDTPNTPTSASTAAIAAHSPRPPSAMDLYAAAMQGGGLGEQTNDPNRQAGKERFFNQDIRDLGYLPNAVVPQMSSYELKRGSVIPATLITGINSDLPGRITAQVSQNVYDSATGRHLLIPQGSKLFGRYDSNVSFGQHRVLVVWTDIVFPNGSTLQIGGMAGTDAAGYSGFKDRVDNHYLRTFGSAVLVALIGTGAEMILPQDRSAFGTANSTEDAARRSFAEAFGQMSQQTVSRNLNVQPTLEIRPGYRFNVLVDQDVVIHPR